MIPMSEYESTVVSEGYLATTIDRKDKNDQCSGMETSFLSGRFWYVYKPVLYNALL